MKKIEERGKLFEKFYVKCGRDDKILMAVGIEMVSLYKADNKKEEGEKSEDALSQELADLNNFLTKLPHGQQRKDFFPGGH